MQYPHRAAENNKAAHHCHDVLPGDEEGAASVNNDDTGGGECGTEWVAGFRGVTFFPPAVYSPNDDIQQYDGDKSNRDNVE